MLLYSLHDVRGGTITRDDESYTINKDGTLDVPEDFGLYLRDTHVGGVKQWEDYSERNARLAAEEEARRRDPATLLDAVEALQAENVARKAPRKAAPRKAAAKKATPAPRKRAAAKP